MKLNWDDWAKNARRHGISAMAVAAVAIGGEARAQVAPELKQAAIIAGDTARVRTPDGRPKLSERMKLAAAKAADPVQTIIDRVNAENLGNKINMVRIERDAELEAAGRRAPADLLKGIDLRAAVRPDPKARAAAFKLD